MNFLKIFHIDCGRKYFTAEQLKELIRHLGQNQYSAIELAFGNGGMRFLLDDMEVCTKARSYSDSAVKRAINTGNKAFCDCGINELTEGEMEDLLQVAGENGIQILPLLNTPGHMDALVRAMEELEIEGVRYKGSATTMNFDCREAVEFSQALLTKYIQWFAARGSEYFNMGCDEYANDVLSSGFAVLCDKKDFQYDRFVGYVNEVAGIVLNHHMKPIMFNDGMYYNEELQGGDFRTDILCSYWSVGWPGYHPASARFIEKKGHKILNTADKWYYVLGRRSEQRPVVQFTNRDSEKGIATVRKSEVLGGTADEPVGAMFCLWCDEPYMTYSDEEVDIVKDLLTKFGQ